MQTNNGYAQAIVRPIYLIPGRDLPRFGDTLYGTTSSP